MTINDRVHEIRTALNMTLDAFGSRLNVTKVAISNIEKGKNNLSERMLCDICREFNVNEMWLRTGTGEMFESTSMEEEIASFAKKVINYGSESFQARMVSALSRLDEAGWAVLEKLADDMAKENEKSQE